MTRRIRVLVLIVSMAALTALSTTAALAFPPGPV
jgi:hypothetical protein